MRCYPGISPERQGKIKKTLSRTEVLTKNFQNIVQVTMLVGEVSVKTSVVGKQNQVRVHFVIGQKMKDPRIHPFSGTTRFCSCNALLNRLHFQELCVRSCWTLNISSISGKVSRVIWKKVFNPSAKFIQLIFSQLQAFKIFSLSSYHSISSFNILLTVHPNIISLFHQLDAQILYF
jgi:hypothetical protein